MSEISRLFGVFFEPKKTFEDIAERPRWLAPVLITIVASLVLIYLFNTHIGWESYLHRVFDNNPRVQQLTAEQRESAFNLQMRILPVATYGGAVVGTPLTLAFMALIAMGIIRGLLGAPIRYGQAFAVMAYAWLPRVIFTGLSIAVMFLKNPDDFDIQNSFASNPGAFMDPQKTSRFIYSIAGSLDLFTIWVMLLMAVGLKAAGGKRLSFGGALFSVALPWVVWVFCRAGLAAAGLMGS